MERARLAAEYFPETISRDRAKKMLRRALELLEKPKRHKVHSCARGNIDQDAKNALRFLTGDPAIGSTSEDSSHVNSGPGSQNDDPQVCEADILIKGTQRRVSP